MTKDEFSDKEKWESYNEREIPEDTYVVIFLKHNEVLCGKRFGDTFYFPDHSSYRFMPVLSKDIRDVLLLSEVILGYRVGVKDAREILERESKLYKRLNNPLPTNISEALGADRDQKRFELVKALVGTRNWILDQNQRHDVDGKISSLINLADKILEELERC